MTKKTVKKTTKKSSKIKDEFNKALAKKLHERFSGIKTKDKGDVLWKYLLNNERLR